MAYNPLLNPVDYILLEGQRSPGLADLSGFGSPRKWDEQNGYGFSGAFAIFRGRKLAKGTVTLRLYTDEDWSGWESWRPLVSRPPNLRIPRALDIWHPWLEMLEIKSVQVEDVLQPREIDNGGYAIDLKFLEYREPKLTLAKPEASEAEASDDPVDQKIESLRGENEQLQAILEGLP